MNENDLKHMVVQGLRAQNAAAHLGDDAAAEIANDATNPELKELLRKGSEQAKGWQDRFAEALRKMGADAGTIDNPIIKAHYEVSKKIRAEAPSSEARDLGIIAAGQLVMHYYIAGLGTLRTYAERSGEGDSASVLQSMLDEAKAADEAHTQLAQKILAG